jgi:hypothetical protein
MSSHIFVRVFMMANSVAGGQTSSSPPDRHSREGGNPGMLETA